MHAQQRQRTQERLAQGGLTRALFADIHSIKWLTGFNPPIQLGPSFFVGGPPLLWYDNGTFTLIVLDGHADSVAAFGAQPDCTLVTYEGYTIQKPITGGPNLSAVLRDVVGSSAGGGPVGVEARSLTFLLHDVINDVLGGVTSSTIDDWLAPLRMVKTAEEIVKLRDNFALSDLGHRVARQVIKPGLREIDIWAEIHGSIQREVGERVPLGNDCVVGYRQNNIGGWPGDLLVREDDSVIVDLSTVRHGYWSDSCATYYATKPGEAQSAAHRMIEDALAFAISLVRPGVQANEIDRKVRGFIEARGYPVYPHHTGHGVGVTGHEEPRIVPYNEVPLAAGMVILLEPGTYVPGAWGVRLEDALLVTEDGAEVLTTHEKGMMG
ncbi:M24 family metallopeptidase [bacterium]|nr:M24 family metallopeptidase [bacterium]